MLRLLKNSKAMPRGVGKGGGNNKKPPVVETSHKRMAELIVKPGTFLLSFFLANDVVDDWALEAIYTIFAFVVK